MYKECLYSCSGGYSMALLPLLTFDTLQKLHRAAHGLIVSSNIRHTMNAQVQDPKSAQSAPPICENAPRTLTALESCLALAMRSCMPHIESLRHALRTCSACCRTSSPCSSVPATPCHCTCVHAMVANNQRLSLSSVPKLHPLLDEFPCCM